MSLQDHYISRSLRFVSFPPCIQGPGYRLCDLWLLGGCSCPHWDEMYQNRRFWTRQRQSYICSSFDVHGIRYKHFFMNIFALACIKYHKLMCCCVCFAGLCGMIVYSWWGNKIRSEFVDPYFLELKYVMLLLFWSYCTSKFESYMCFSSIV